MLFWPVIRNVLPKVAKLTCLMTQQREKKKKKNKNKKESFTNLPLLFDSDNPVLSKICCPELLQGLHFEGSAWNSGVPLRKSQALGKGTGAMNLWSFTIKSQQRNPDENSFLSYHLYTVLRYTTFLLK